MSPTAGTRVFALLGDPVAHSFSPSMQNAAMRAHGLDAVYVALRIAHADVRPVLRALALAGGGGNVTVPHKVEAAAALDGRTKAVLATGACNTFWCEAGRVVGDNTDVHGFVTAVQRLAGPLHGGHVLVMGAGGAAAAVVHGLAEAGADRVTLVNRTTARAQELAVRFPSVARVATLDNLTDTHFDLVVNSTSLGLRAADPLPLDLDALPLPGAVMDLVVAHGMTRFARAAAERGIPAADGREMLLHQGSAAFTAWFGVPAPLEAMRVALDEAVRT